MPAADHPQAQPAEQDQPEDTVGEDVDEGGGPEDEGVPGPAQQQYQGAAVEEDGVDLHEQTETAEADELVGDEGGGEAGDDDGVVSEQDDRLEGDGTHSAVLS